MNETTQHFSAEVVISRFKENVVEVIEFIHRSYPAWNITVYNKGSDSEELLEILGNENQKRKNPHLYSLLHDTKEKCGKLKLQDLPNVGREGHTYLQHIKISYNSLSPVTVFLPGSCMN